MPNCLHILNGDSTANIFNQTQIKGDVLIWREMLCEGQLQKDIGSDQFWKSRYNFYEQELQLDKLDYYDKTIKELIKIEDLAAYDEVTLWFEYDLFCQINLLGLCTYLLKHYKKSINYYLVCTGFKKEEKQMQTLSDYNIHEYKDLLQNRTKLTRNDFLFMQKSWEIYVENDKVTIANFDFNQNKKVIYLQAAINQHLKRFKDKKGLNQIDYQTIKWINSGINQLDSLISKLLVWQRENTVYGFGDTQYLIYIKKLKPYITIKNRAISLTQKGKRILDEN